MDYRTYSSAVVTYLDLLGFSKLIHDSQSNPVQTAKILEILKNVKMQCSQGGRIHRNEEGAKEKIFYSFNFSDLTVRCTLVPTGADLSNFLSWSCYM